MKKHSIFWLVNLTILLILELILSLISCNQVGDFRNVGTMTYNTQSNQSIQIDKNGLTIQDESITSDSTSDSEVSNVSSAMMDVLIIVFVAVIMWGLVVGIGAGFDKK